MVHWYITPLVFGFGLLGGYFFGREKRFEWVLIVFIVYSIEMFIVFNFILR